MKKLITIITLITGIVGCSPRSPEEKTIEKDNLFISTIPDLYFFNINNKIKNGAISLIRGNDTIAIYSYDTLGRFRQYNYMKMWSRKENVFYFGRTSFPIHKSVRVDYSLSFNGSLVKLNSDTIKTYWYHEFGDICDTSIYIFEKNKIKQIELPPLNDYDRQRVKKTFTYNGDKIKKITTLPLWGEAADGFGKSDSSVAVFTYNNDIVVQIIENRYFKNKNYNHSNSYYFDNSGFPVKCTIRDTMNLEIKTLKNFK